MDVTTHRNPRTRAVVRLRRFAALILTAGLASSAAEDARAEQPPKVELFHGKMVVPKHYRGDVRNLPQLAPGTLEEFERPDEQRCRRPARTLLHPRRRHLLRRDLQRGIHDRQHLPPGRHLRRLDGAHHVNGVDQGSSAHTGAVDDTTVPLVISTSSVSIWNGRLEEIAIYGQALTSTQVQAHYTGGLSG